MGADAGPHWICQPSAVGPAQNGLARRLLSMLRKIVLALLISAGAFAQAQTPLLKQFLLRIEPVRKDFTLQGMTADEHKIAASHFMYLKSLHAEGKIALAAQVFLQPALDDAKEAGRQE